MPSAIHPNHVQITDKPVSLSTNQVKNVAIIGGGASGAVALDSLLKEGHFDSITLFERRDTVGGVWNLDEATIETPNQIIKSGYTHIKTDPQLPNPFHDTPIDSKSKFLVTPKIDQERFEKTPSYQGIKTNVLERMMTYSDVNSWGLPGVTDPEESKFVGGLVVRDYIDRYIKRNAGQDNVNIVYNTTVEDVERISKSVSSSDEIPYQFRLTLRQKLNEHEDIWYQEIYDSVVVSIGHYHVPYIPYVPGLQEIQEQHPSVVQHAKFYREPSSYKDKTVLVVGSRASGADLSKFLADVSTTVYQSIRNVLPNLRLSKKPNIILKPKVKEYKIIDNKNFKVIFDDDSELLNPDNILYATGYQFSFPFLNRLFENDNTTLTEQGIILPNLYQHTFFINEPLINIIGVPIDGVSFRVFEYQAVLIARFITGKISLPTRQEQSKWILERFKAKGIHRSYHTIGVDDAFEYLHGLVDLGKIKDPALITGRQFPKLTSEDMAIYRAAGEKLREFWDER